MKRLNIKALYVALTLIMILASGHKASAQHTLTLVGGTGSTYARFYPYAETKWIWMADSYGISWRYYSDSPRFVGAVGVDLDYMERGFLMGYAYTSEFIDDKEIRHYQFYRRDVQSLMLPMVWQPHFYLIKNHLRVYLEAAPTFSYNFSSTFQNDESYSIDKTLAPKSVSGKYHFRAERDNRFSFGLAGGGGFDLIFGQFEFGVRARYDFGFSDILRNRNKYYSNNLDMIDNPGENPFSLTPLRSPLDNLTISLKVGFRIGKAGFKEWEWKKPKLPKNKEVFKYTF